jgi:hypothetical protein
MNYKAHKNNNIIKNFFQYSSEDEIVVLTVDTSIVDNNNNENKSTFNVGWNFRFDYDYINIDFGDGTSISSSDRSAIHYFTHEYEINSGLKQVIITGKNIRRVNFTTSIINLIYSNIVNINKFNLPNLTDCSYLFYNCNNLTAIPDNLFDNNTEVISFGSCFRDCSNLTAIPDNLFDNNTEVTRFDTCFSGCSNLTTVPSNLFQYNTLVTNFSSCFYECTDLITIPSNLFQYNTLVTNFSSCFYNDSSITSSVPELWNRTNVTDYTRCYYNCSKAANYSSIPASWR